MTSNLKRFFGTLVTVVFILVVLLFLGPLYIVNEGNQVVVTRFGSIVTTHSEAGLYLKMPFVDTITTYPRLVLSLDGDPQRIPTKENQYIIVDTTARWIIEDPALFYQNFTSLNNAYNKLSDIVDSSTRTIITQNRLSEIVRSSNIINDAKADNESTDEDTKEIADLVNVNTVNELVTKGRRELSRQMTDAANRLVPEYGIKIIDILPRQVKYSDELTESVYSKMIKERNQIAQAYRSNGEGKKAEWLGKLENKKQTISSEAYKRSEEIKGNADAEAARIYADSYNKDPEFYTFWKSMESYKKTMKANNATYSTGMDYFNYLYAPNGKR
ncbi:MAG: protease modulator HflC [Treponema sp.]|nr:protease modulator HflC [Treponema sp.]